MAANMPKSDDRSLPEHLIMSHILPVKSLTRFKAVSHNWYSTISSPEFAKSHIQLSSPPLQFITLDNKEQKIHLSTCDAPGNKVKEVVPLDFDFETQYIKLVGSCHELFCLYVRDYLEFVVWNPATGECRDIPCPEGLRGFRALGFVYSASLNDYKIVALYEVPINNPNVNYGDRTKQLYVYSFGNKEWRRIPCPDGGVSELNGGTVLIGEDFYWNSQFSAPLPISRFNLVDEQLEKKPQMEWLTSYKMAYLFKVHGCLALQCTTMINEPSDIWMLEDHNDWNSSIVWKRRNAAIFRQENQSATTTISSILSLSTTFGNAFQKDHPPHPTHEDPTWIPPTTHQLKINVDASWVSAHSAAGAGIIARDRHGKWIRGGVMKQMAAKPVQAELHAIKMGLSLCIQEGWNDVLISSDCKIAVSMINDCSYPLQLGSNIAFDCRELRHQLSGSQIQYEDRKTNRAVDLLAKEARRYDLTLGQLHVLYHPPPPILDVCNEEFNSVAHPLHSNNLSVTNGQSPNSLV